MKIPQIAVGIIRNPRKPNLYHPACCRRPYGEQVEFPGGKIEAGETPEAALVRELQEEVGITPLGATLFDKLEYQFPDRHITLWFWLVENWEGEPWGKEGQPGNWVELQASDAEKFPPANEPVILRLVEQPKAC